MLLQETYEVMDCILYDGGTSSDHNDIWTIARGTVNRQTEYSSIELTSGQTNVMVYFNLTEKDNFIIEFDAMFDCTNTSGLSDVQFRNSNWNTQQGALKLNDYPKDTWTHIKFEKTTIDEVTKRIAYVNGEKVSTIISPTDDIFVFMQHEEDNYLYFKNFKYYPI